MLGKEPARGGACWGRSVLEGEACWGEEHVSL